MAFFVNIDFESHVALVAPIDEDGRAAIRSDAIEATSQSGQLRGKSADEGRVDHCGCPYLATAKPAAGARRQAPNSFSA
jgi:hypothetical protein